MDSLIKIYQIFTPVEKRYFKMLFFISIITMILETLSISMLIPLLNLVLSNNTENIVFEYVSIFQDIFFLNKYNYSTILLILIIFIFFVKTLVMIFFIYFKNKFVYDLKASLSSRLYKRLSLSDYDYFLNTNSSIIINYLSKEIDEFISLIDSGITFFTETIIITGLL